MPATDDAGRGGRASIEGSQNSHSDNEASGNSRRKPPAIPMPGEGIRFPHQSKFVCDVTYLAGHMRVTEETVREWLRKYKVPCQKIGDSQFFDTDVFLSKMPPVDRDEKTSKRRGDAAETPAGKVEGDRRRRVETKRKARPKDKDL